jgi:hypothetical protein
VTGLAGRAAAALEGSVIPSVIARDATASQSSVACRAASRFLLAAARALRDPR